jgi:hypothetical protein
VLEYVLDAGKAIRSISDSYKQGKIDESEIEDKCRKILALKYWAGLHKPRQINRDNLDETINRSSTKALIRDLYVGAITVLNNDDNIIPVKNEELTDTRLVTKIDFGKEAFPMEYTQSEEKFTAHKYQYSYLYIGSPVLESEKFLYFRYRRKKKIYTGLYSKAEKKLYSLYRSSLKLKSSNLNAMLLDPVYASEKNWFVSLLQPEMLLNIKKSELALPPYLQHAVKNIQIDDNTVLVFFKLKDRPDR